MRRGDTLPPLALFVSEEAAKENQAFLTEQEEEQCLAALEVAELRGSHGR